MPTCREVSRLISSGAYGESVSLRHALVRLHLLLCDDCSRYAREIAGLGEQAKVAFAKPLDADRLRELERVILERVNGGTTPGGGEGPPSKPG